MINVRLLIILELNILFKILLNGFYTTFDHLIAPEMFWAVKNRAIQDHPVFGVHGRKVDSEAALINLDFWFWVVVLSATRFK